MVPELPRRPTPPWLLNLPPDLPPLPLHDVLTRSLYYGASGQDGAPVELFGGFTHSFIYVDYGVTQETVLASIQHPHLRFLGYRLFGHRDLGLDGLAPNGWTPKPPTENDGDPKRGMVTIPNPYAAWYVFEREQGYDENHGPSRFSLLYLGGDAVATFQALYDGNGCYPEAVAIIQPGTGFGGNWTDFGDPAKIFARSVLQNRYGTPSYLLYGGYGRFYDTVCWPEFSVLIHRVLRAPSEIGVWARPMLIQHPTEEQWRQLYDNCCSCSQDIDYLNKYPYDHVRVPENGHTFVTCLRQSETQCWLIKAGEEHDQIVGFINYGNVIRTQPNAFGLVIGRRFAGKGYGKRALVEFIIRRKEFAIGEVNGYCHQRNTAIIRLMKGMEHDGARFEQDTAFRDPRDPNAIKFRLIARALPEA